MGEVYLQTTAQQSGIIKSIGFNDDFISSTSSARHRENHDAFKLGRA
jgi:hypothetical protein